MLDVPLIWASSRMKNEELRILGKNRVVGFAIVDEEGNPATSGCHNCDFWLVA